MSVSDAAIDWLLSSGDPSLQYLTMTEVLSPKAATWKWSTVVGGDRTKW
jgi:hypothetical protein